MSDRRIEPGDGTPESAWLAWLDSADLPRTAVDALLPSTSRVVVIAPHPDDEILTAGGLLAAHAAQGGDCLIVAVTDGDASHPGSSLWPAQRLLRTRPEETERALQTLWRGGRAGNIQRLQLSDGQIGNQRSELIGKLAPLLTSADVVITTWRLDGHPDHEATAQAAITATRDAGAALLEVPVWAWHWATPGDTRLPWHRARRIDLDLCSVTQKQAAIRAFASQLHPDPSTGQAPVLRASTVARCDRSFEVVFT